MAKDTPFFAERRDCAHPVANYPDYRSTILRHPKHALAILLTYTQYFPHLALSPLIRKL